MSEEIDFNLRLACTEIDKVMRKYDIGGALSLVSKTHGEMLIRIPEWTAVRINNKDNTATVNIDTSLYKTEKEVDQLIKVTTIFCIGCIDGLEILKTNMDTISCGVSKEWGIEFPGNAQPEESNIISINKNKPK